MYIFITILIIVVSIFIMLFVLAQNPKGGGASAMMGGMTNQVLGARRSSDFLEKGTWYLGIALFALCLVSSFFVDRGSVSNTDAETQKILDNAPATTSQPVAEPAANPDGATPISNDTNK